MSVYPIAYEQSPPVQRSRLTVFFRFLMVIPHAIWAMFYGLAAYLVSFVAWFAILFTGQFPAGMYDFLAGYMRFATRFYGYALLLTDTFPPFDGGEHPEYEVRLKVGPRQQSYSRLKAFFRLILAIPIFILEYLFQIWLLFVAIAIWFVAVVTGKTSPGLTEAMRFPISYYARATPYVYLMTDVYPPLSDGEAPLPHLAG